MEYFGLTDTGKKRSENQDCFGVYEYPSGALLTVVCDGMGGENGGAVASKTALESFIEECKNIDVSAPDAALRAAFSRAVSAANLAVLNKAKSDESLSGMGTTLVASLVVKDGGRCRVCVINIGDSRAYKFAGGVPEQLSHDHSYVQYLIDLGELTPEKAAKRRDRNLLMRAIGTEESARADVDFYDYDVNDLPTYLLLCSDGLWGLVSDADMIKKTQNDDSVENKVRSLIALANRRGGTDNITAVAVRL